MTSTDLRASIRIGVRVVGAVVPRWQASVLDQLVKSEEADVRLLLIDRRVPRSSLGSRLKGGLYKLYEASDRRYYKDADDPFEPAPVVQPEGAHVLEFNAVDGSFRNAVRAHGLDVIVFFEPD